jgi:hypothetical protein
MWFCREVGDIETSASLIAGSARIDFIKRHFPISVNPLHQFPDRTAYVKTFSNFSEDVQLDPVTFK